MSLLLEALKKAELAKQQAEPSLEPAPETARSGPKADELSLVEEPREPVITRENLPNISQTLEIRSEDLPSTARNSERIAQQSREPDAAAASRQPAIGLSEPVAASQPPSGPEPAAPGAGSAGMRDAARQMFDVKEEVDYNPRKPFYITIGALLAAGVGYGVYVWWQMQPHYAVNTAAVNVSAARRPEPAPEAAPAPQAVAPQPAPVSAAPGPIAAPGSVAAPKVVESAPESPAKAAPAAPTFRPAREAAVREAAARPGAAAARRGEAQTPISITPSTLQADPALQAAYDAYERGEWQNARAQYERVLERDPGNRDALLGLAALDVREHSYDTAELRYLKLLEFNPRDTHAFAGLMALQGNLDPVQSESRIKTLLASQPDATHLYFTLGNQYAAQGRWSEAQEAYFKAYAANPLNPDYAFNLAVSLDHLRQPRLALDYYRKALAASGRQPAAFNRQQAEARAAELQR